MERAEPVTLADVQAALEQIGVDATETNAAIIRETLGRGSYRTIQKHLDALRSALKESEPEIVDTPPEAPREILAGIWSAVWAEAAQRYGAKLLAAEARASDLAGRLETATSDLDELLSDLDRVQAERDEAVQKAEQTEQGMAIERQSIAQERAGIKAERQALEALMERLRGMLPPQ